MMVQVSTTPPRNDHPLRSHPPSGQNSMAKSTIPVILLFALWGGLASVTAGPTDYESAQRMYSIATIILGAYIFWSHGGRQVNATGLYGLGSMIFTGLAGIYWSLDSATIVTRSLYLATAAGFWTTLGIHFLVSLIRPPAYEPITLVDRRSSAWLIRLSLLVIAMSTVVSRGAGADLTQFSLAGVGMLVVALALRRPNARRVTFKVAVAAVIIFAAATLLFSAFGRLMLVALGLVAVVATSSQAKDRRAKAISLASILPVTYFLVRFREDAQRDMGYSSQHVDGLGSAISPIKTLARLLDEQVTGLNGESFLASAFFWIPRSMWEGKPLGLGSAITAELEPQLRAVGHSMAAQSVGEWYFNWGWWGVVAMMPTLALIFRLLDGFLARRLAAPLRTRRDLLWLMGALFLVAEVPVLAWSGSFTYSTRGVTKFVFVLILLVTVRNGAKQVSRGKHHS